LIVPIEHKVSAKWHSVHRGKGGETNMAGLDQQRRSDFLAMLLVRQLSFAFLYVALCCAQVSRNVLHASDSLPWQETTKTGLADNTVLDPATACNDTRRVIQMVRTMKDLMWLAVQSTPCHCLAELVGKIFVFRVSLVRSSTKAGL
jgi:hypothetical protein